MKAAFDTSVIVAALVPAHPSHARAFVWLDAVATGQLEGAVSAHAIAETYSVLTKLPLRPAITPAQAGAMIDRLRPILSVISEDAAIVEAAVARCASVGASTGAIFDAVHVMTAESAKADVIVTFNEGHFRRLAVPATPRIVVPPDPPSTVA